MKVILVSGKAQNGKDTTAGFMAERLKRDGKRVLITHYADLLKYICTSYFGWNGVKDDAGRKMLQYVGTDVIRQKNPTLWVDFVAMILDYFQENWDYVFIPDCRFPNEIDSIKAKFDAIHLRVVRENFVSPLSPEQQCHISETALDDVTPDYYICNKGTLSDLDELLNKFIDNNF